MAVDCMGDGENVMSQQASQGFLDRMIENSHDQLFGKTLDVWHRHQRDLDKTLFGKHGRTTILVSNGLGSHCPCHFLLPSFGHFPRHSPACVVTTGDVSMTRLNPKCLWKHRAVCTASAPLALREVTRTVATVLMSTLLFWQPVGIALADMRFEPRAGVSQAVAAEQRALVETRNLISTLFVDETFNGMGQEGWLKEVEAALERTNQEGTTDATVRSEVDALLAKLGDRYTRVVRGTEEAALKLQVDGQVGVPAGLELAVRPADECIVVVDVQRYSPAEEAGVQPGDVLLAIAKQDIEPGTPGLERASIMLAAVGPRGTGLVFQRGGGIFFVKLKPRELRIEPVIAGLACRGAPLVPVQGFASCKDSAAPVGYVLIRAFTSDVPEKAAEALRSLAAAGAPAFVLDLRGNQGGVESASIRVAALFLGTGKPVTTLRSRGGAEAQILTPEPVANIGPQLREAMATAAKAKLAVIVDDNTASSSELVTAALRASGRASILGPSASFGKGRSQAVRKLSTGAELLITTEEFLAPGGERIDGVGIKPKLRCQTSETDLRNDPCIAAAVQSLGKR